MKNIFDEIKKTHQIEQIDKMRIKGVDMPKDAYFYKLKAFKNLYISDYDPDWEMYVKNFADGEYLRVFNFNNLKGCTINSQLFLVLSESELYEILSEFEIIQ